MVWIVSRISWALQLHLSLPTGEHCLCSPGHNHRCHSSKTRGKGDQLQQNSPKEAASSVSNVFSWHLQSCDIRGHWDQYTYCALQTCISCNHQNIKTPPPFFNSCKSPFLVLHLSFNSSSQSYFPGVNLDSHRFRVISSSWSLTEISQQPIKHNLR